MRISAQSIQTVGGQSGPLATIVAGLKPGDSLAAQVLGRNPAGLTLIALAGKQLHLPLPQNLAPGTLINLTVQQGTNGLQFLIEPQPGGTQPGTAQTGQPTSTQSNPQAILQAGIPTSLGAGIAAQPAGQPPQGPVPQALSQAPTPSGFGSSTQLPPLVNARTGLPVPAPHGSAAGQAVTAQVLSAPSASTAIISVAGQELPVSLPTPSAPGSTLTLVVQNGPNGLQFAHAKPGSAPVSTPSPQSGGASPGVQSPSPQQAANAPATALAAPSIASSAIAQASATSLGNQNSVSVLLASVLKLGDRARDLPDGVQRALNRLTSAALPLDGKAPDAAALQRAVQRSGVFLEAQLAAGSSNVDVDADVKVLLFALRRALGNWLGGEAKPAVLTGKPPPPPQPGTAPRQAAPPQTALLDDLPIEDVGKALLSQTDAALSRLRLTQIASLPERNDAQLVAKQVVQVEVPVTIGQQPGVLSLVITRDDEGDTPDQRKRAWRVQFAINASEIGEVGAEIGFLAGRTNVVLSASDQEAVTALADNLTELSDALEGGGLQPGVLRVRKMGAPPPSAFSPAKNQPAHYLDRDT